MHEVAKSSLGIFLKSTQTHSLVVGSRKESLYKLNRQSVRIDSFTPVTYIRPEGQGQYVLSEDRREKHVTSLRKPANFRVKQSWKKKS